MDKTTTTFSKKMKGNQKNETFLICCKPTLAFEAYIFLAFYKGKQTEIMHFYKRLSK